jgi:hypothetical protein
VFLMHTRALPRHLQDVQVGCIIMTRKTCEQAGVV